MTLYKRALQVINNYYNTYSGLTVPTIVKTVAASGDYFIGIDSTNTPYKISKADLLAGLSSGGSGGSSGGGQHRRGMELLCSSLCLMQHHQQMWH